MQHNGSTLAVSSDGGGFRDAGAGQGKDSYGLSTVSHSNSISYATSTTDTGEPGANPSTVTTTGVSGDQSSVYSEQSAYGGPVEFGSYSSGNSHNMLVTLLSTTTEISYTGMGEQLTTVTTVMSTDTTSGAENTHGGYLGSISMGESNSSGSHAWQNTTTVSDSFGSTYTTTDAGSTATSNSSAFDNGDLPTFTPLQIPAMSNASFPSGPWEKEEKDNARKEDDEDPYATSPGNKSDLEEDVGAAGPDVPAAQGAANNAGAAAEADAKAKVPSPPPVRMSPEEIKQKVAAAKKDPNQRVTVNGKRVTVETLDENGQVVRTDEYFYYRGEYRLKTVTIDGFKPRQLTPFSSSRTLALRFSTLEWIGSGLSKSGTRLGPPRLLRTQMESPVWPRPRRRWMMLFISVTCTRNGPATLMKWWMTS